MIRSSFCPSSCRKKCKYKKQNATEEASPSQPIFYNTLKITHKLRSVRFVVFIRTQVLLNFLPTVSRHLRNSLFLYNTVEIVYCCCAHDVTKSHMNGISLYVVHEPWEMPAHSNCEHTQTATLPCRLSFCQTASTDTLVSPIGAAYQVRTSRHQPPVRWERRNFPLGVKGLDRQADHSPASNAEVENEWRLPTLHHMTSSPVQGHLYIYDSWNSD